MSFFKKFFSKGKNEPPTGDNDLPRIAPADNPWHLNLLDLRPLTQTTLSSSQDPRMAENAISYGTEDGSTFWGRQPQNGRTTEVNIVVPTDNRLEAGVLFKPEAMEHKWAIYFDGESLIFVRSWLREVFVVAKTSQTTNRLVITHITGAFTEGESPAFTAAVLSFLLISHSIGEVVPAPLPAALERDPKAAGLWAFSTYGSMAHIGVFGDSFIPATDAPLRSHSLLHIAVAQGNIAAIEDLARTGAGLNALAGDGLAPLHWSLASLTTDAMKKLFELGADPDARSSEGATPLMNAVQSNKMEKLMLLLEAGAQVNAQDNRGFTALHRAAEMGQIGIVRVLLERGADTSLAAEGHTALSLATMAQQGEIVRLLNG